MRVQKTVEAEVPAGFFLYDIATEDISCRACKKTKNRGDNGDSRADSYHDLQGFFDGFAREHLECIVSKKPKNKKSNIRAVS